MENRLIPNSAVTASSSYGIHHEPWQARLNNVHSRSSSGQTGSWSSSSLVSGEWLQIDLGESKVITKLATQGRPEVVHYQWVTLYKFAFSRDNVSWEEYKEGGISKVSVTIQYLEQQAQ